MKVIVRFAVNLTDRERAALGVRTRRDVKDDLTRRASALLRSDLEDLVRIHLASKKSASKPPASRSGRVSSLISARHDAPGLIWWTCPVSRTAWPYLANRTEPVCDHPGARFVTATPPAAEKSGPCIGGARR